ncbi:ABC transporter ATP-binding protein [Phytoactinopolyspora endophytica]|uniref:ABC transporter ATP-binding protein n=1 Tax=Phytoactinopolyspora endophytica TaxID=1642495 RepID=UPI00101C3333|nr:oligopeptide/dipeptide ABC transporter ATP-binding protein [Phytoactinopolyspora endophytica]
MTPILELDDVRKHYTTRSGLARRTSSVRAVDGVSLRLERGETLGLVGESGCGKSTLARTLVLLEKPDSGEIRFDGRPVAVTDAASLRRDAQIVFQDPYTSLPPHMKVRRIIAEPLMIHRIASGAELRARVDELIADVGLPGTVADKLPGQLSGGQRQRVSIARALALEPSLLIADESVSALDVSVQAQILNLLNGLRERHGLTLLFVSHDIGVVTYVSQRIAVMYLGKIVEMGPTADVYGNALHPYTRALMAAVPSMEHRGRERIEVRGDPPDPRHPPPGCAYHPRCPIAQDICRVESPPVREWLPGRHAACHFALDGVSDGRNTG